MNPYLNEDGKWEWYDEAYNIYGPYDTEEEAFIDYSYYVRFILGEDIKGAN